MLQCVRNHNIRLIRQEDFFNFIEKYKNMSQDVLTVNAVTLAQEDLPLTKEVDNTESSSELALSKTAQQVDDIISKLRKIVYMFLRNIYVKSVLAQ